MLYMGISAFRSFHPLDSSRYIFGLPPVALAAVILGCMATMPRKFCRGTIHIRESGVEFNPGDHDLNVHFPWKDLFFSATQNKQQMVRSLVLVHRERKMIFYDLFTRDYDLLVAAITRVKARSNKTQVDGGLKIDSGRIGDIDPRIRGR